MVENIKVGQINILPNNIFVLVCEFCKSDCYALGLEGFVTHITGHFPQQPTTIKNEDPIIITDSECEEEEAVINHGEEKEFMPPDITDNVNEAANVNQENMQIDPKLNGSIKRNGHTNEANQTKGDTLSKSACRQRGFKCRFWSKIFRDKWGLNYHTDVHNENDRLRCNMCSKTYANAKNRLKHVKQVHTENMRRQLEKKIVNKSKRGARQGKSSEILPRIPKGC